MEVFFGAARALPPSRAGSGSGSGVGRAAESNGRAAPHAFFLEFSNDAFALQLFFLFPTIDAYVFAFILSPDSCLLSTVLRSLQIQILQPLVKHRLERSAPLFA